MGMHPRGQSVDVRFWLKVERGAAAECWEWQGLRTGQGYGRLRDGRGGKVLAHRFSWMLTNGPVPDGLFVLHTCDNPPCCNPAHLYIGTKLQNAKDREARGRGHDKRGAANARSKLSDRDVREIRRALQSGETQVALAARFGVSQSLMSLIKRREAWNHISDTD